MGNVDSKLSIPNDKTLLEAIGCVYSDRNDCWTKTCHFDKRDSVCDSDHGQAACAEVPQPCTRQGAIFLFSLAGRCPDREQKSEWCRKLWCFFFLFFFWYRKEEWEKGPTPRWAQAQPGVEECHHCPFGRQQFPLQETSALFFLTTLKKFCGKNFLGAMCTGRGKCS